MRGRPPKPTELHIADGTFRPDRHGNGTPTIVAGRRALRPPRGMPREVATAFRALAKVLASITDAADATLVESAAVQLARARAAGQDIAMRGLTIEVHRTGRGGIEYDDEVPNPNVALERQAWAEFRQLADRLGIGPAARARLASLAVEGRTAEEEFDELAELRQRRGGA